MKAHKLYTSFLAVIFVCIGMAAVAQPNWSVNPNLYDYSMSVTGKITVDGTYSVDVNDKVAAFIGGECRGVINVKYQSALNDYFIFLLIYGSDPTGSVSFKIYDASENKEIEVGTTMSFAVNGIKGSISSPYNFTGVTKTYDAKILSFYIPSQEGTSSIGSTTISLTQKITGDLSYITPVFALSEGAKAYVNNVLQVSGSTSNDFRNSVRYKIVPQVGDPKYYRVSISKAVDTSTEILLSNATVVENKDSVSVGVLSAQSDVLGDSYSFSLVADNQMFYIEGDKLYVKKAINFELSPQYEVNVKVDNNSGISKENTFVVDVLNQNDPPTGLSLSTNTISEGTAINKLVARISAEDEDAGDVHSYRLKSGNGLNDEGNSYFTIQGDSLVLKEQIINLGKENFKILIAVSDSSGTAYEKECAFQVVDINKAPQITTSPVAFAVQNQVYVYQVIVEDKEGDNTTIRFEGLPDWLTFQENTNLLSGYPKNNNVGDIEFKIIVSDGGKESVQTVVISILNVNDPPEITQYPGTQYLFTGKENKITLPENMITDPDTEDQLTFQLSTENNSALPDWLIFDPVALTITGNPPGDERGEYNLKLTATDDAGSKEYLIFKLEVSFPTAIGDQNSNKLFKAYPNPVQHNLYIETPDGTEDAFVSISNIAGQVIKSWQLNSGLTKEVSMSGFESGIYFVRIQQGKLQQITKIIKE